MLKILNRNKGNSPTSSVESKGKVTSSSKKSSSSSSLDGGGKGGAVKAKKSGAKNGIKATKSGNGGKKKKANKNDNKNKPSSSSALDEKGLMKSNSCHVPSKRTRPARGDDFVKQPPARHKSLEDLMAINSKVAVFESETAQNRAANSKLAEMSRRGGCNNTPNVRIRSLNDNSRGRDGLDTRSEHTRRSRSSSRGPMTSNRGGRSAGLDSKSDHRPRSVSRGPSSRGRGRGACGGLDSKSEHIRRDKTPMRRSASMSRKVVDKPPSTPARSKSLDSDSGLFELSPIAALEKRSQEKKETIELKKQVDELQGQLQGLERQNNALQTVNDNLQSKLRIQKLDHDRLIEERDKEIKELSDTVEKIMGGGRTSNSLFGGKGKNTGSADDDLSKIKEEKNQLHAKYKVSEDNLQKQKKDYEEKMKFKDETIDHLMNELQRVKQKGNAIDGSERARKTTNRNVSNIDPGMGERTGSFGNLANYASAAWDKVSPGALRDQGRNQRLSREERKRMGVHAL